MIRSLSIVLALAAGLASSSACSKSCPAPAAPTTSSDPTVARSMDYERTSCACKDVACATAARVDWETWAEQHHDELEQTMAEVTRELQLDAHRGRAEDCYQARYDASTPAEREAAEAADPKSLQGVLRTMGRFADQLCACKDMACSEQTMKQMAEVKEPARKPSEAEMEQAMKIAERMAECQKKLMEANGASWSEPAQP